MKTDMKTSHQLARELLAGPDCPIAILDPKAKRREDAAHEPRFALIEGQDEDGERCEMIELFGKAPVLATAAT